MKVSSPLVLSGQEAVHRDGGGARTMLGLPGKQPGSAGLAINCWSLT